MNWSLALPILLILNVGFIALGGYVFHRLEGPSEDDARDLSRQRTQDWLANFSCVSQEDLNKLISRILEEKSRGVIAVNNVTHAPSWDLPSAVFFATTVITTIGYGQINPATQNGQLFCVFYALIGIPLLAALLFGIGNSLARLCGKCDVCKLFKIHRICGGILKAVVVFLVGVGIWMCAAAALFQQVEEWTYWQAWYYTFISLTTIGFGDLIPGQKSDVSQRSWYRVVVSAWIIVSLTWFATAVCLLLGALERKQNTSNTAKNKLGEPKVQGLNTDVENGHISPSTENVSKDKDIKQVDKHELTEVHGIAEHEQRHKTTSPPNGTVMTDPTSNQAPNHESDIKAHESGVKSDDESGNKPYSDGDEVELMVIDDITKIENPSAEEANMKSVPDVEGEILAVVALTSERSGEENLPTTNNLNKGDEDIESGGACFPPPPPLPQPITDMVSKEHQPMKDGSASKDLPPETTNDCDVTMKTTNDYDVTMKTTNGYDVTMNTKDEKPGQDSQTHVSVRL